MDDVWGANTPFFGFFGRCWLINPFLRLYFLMEFFLGGGWRFPLTLKLPGLTGSLARNFEERKFSFKSNHHKKGWWKPVVNFCF